MHKNRFRLIAPRPVRPGTLAVRQDWTRAKGLRWAIVSDRELRSGQCVVGHLRGFGESHAGQWVYPFIRRDSALRTARELFEHADALPVWVEE
jgi:hypothetical protein